LAAAAAAVLLAMTAEAPAGACAGGMNCGCGAVVVEAAMPCPPTESYLVNQGPVLSGPGHYLGQLEAAPPCCDIYRYPYVGIVYSGYPFGTFGPATGYPRGFYSPYTGDPYAEPYPYFGRRGHRYVRRHVARPAPAYYNYHSTRGRFAR
jgi:hypothetical protein